MPNSSIATILQVKINQPYAENIRPAIISEIMSRTHSLAEVCMTVAEVLVNYEDSELMIGITPTEAASAEEWYDEITPDCTVLATWRSGSYPVYITYFYLDANGDLQETML